MKRLLSAFSFFIVFQSHALAANPFDSISKGATLYNFHSTGSVGNAAWADRLSHIVIAINIDESSSEAVAQLTYQAMIFDPTSEICVEDPILGMFCHFTRITWGLGFGTIRTSDASISVTSAKVTTNIIGNSGFIFQRCLADEVTGAVECTNAPPDGLLDVPWRKTSNLSYKNIGMREIMTPTEIIKTSGESQEVSAEASGRVFGYTGTTGAASIGVGKGMYVDIIRLK